MEQNKITLTLDSLNALMEKRVKQECKETATEFLQLAYDSCSCLDKRFIKRVEQLAKTFGVKIEGEANDE